MITSANITMQFGAEPLFENISAQFGHGNRYGLIGANGCGKSTFMKILSGDLVPTSGNVYLTPGNKVGVLSQDQFAFEQYSVVDTVIMGDTELWKIKEERDRIYALPEMSEEEGMRVAQLESDFAEMDGYSAESRAGDILIEAGIEEEYHFGLMQQVAPGWKVRV
ncbi:MAG: ATP-binding cassette domain-containing protein, partial [Psychrobium sp.]